MWGLYLKAVVHVSQVHVLAHGEGVGGSAGRGRGDKRVQVARGDEDGVHVGTELAGDAPALEGAGVAGEAGRVRELSLRDELIEVRRGVVAQGMLEGAPIAAVALHKRVEEPGGAEAGGPG